MMVCTLKNFVETFSFGFGVGAVLTFGLALTAVIVNMRLKATGR